MIVSAVFAAETNQKNQSVANQPAANAAKEVLPKRPVEEIHQVRNETFRLIVATLGGGCVAAFLSNWLTVRRERGRDRDQRMREFRGYLAEVESRIERFSDDLKDPDAVKKMWDGYVNLVHMFHRERAKVMTDFQPAPEFDGLCETFGRLQHKHVTEAGKPRDVLAESLKSLTAFTRLRA